MKLLEYEAKQLLASADISVPRSQLIHADKLSTPPLPFMLKAQVPIGGRAKAGGIIIVENREEINTIVKKLLQLEIKGFKASTVLAEEKLSIKKELYLSLTLNRATSGITFMAHTNGGVEVEDNIDFKVWNLNYDSFNVDVIGQELADYYELPDQTFTFQDLIENLYTCFVRNDATLIEINPLILTTDNKLIAGDCKMELDDAAAFRHDWSFEETPAEANFVTIDPKGNIATIANGAGLAMATVDAAYEAGLKPANFLDIGGGADTETLLKAFEKLVEYPNLEAIVINIFAGITRADEVAKAIVAAKKEIANLPPLFIRLAGTNYDQAAQILASEKITIMPDLEACLIAAKEVVHD
ncbi:MAG: ATP-grasp domain-containing protein [Candidatus Microsaccharimonas sp.]